MDKETYKKKLVLISAIIILLVLISIIFKTYYPMRLGLPIALIYVAHYTGKYEGFRKKTFKKR